MNRCSWNVWDCDTKLELFVIRHTRNRVSPTLERNTGANCAFVPSATRCSHGYRSGWHTCELERELWAGRALTVTLRKTTHWWHIFQVECCCGVCVCVSVVTLCICVCLLFFVVQSCQTRITSTLFLPLLVCLLLLFFFYLFHPHKRTHDHVKLAFTTVNIIKET